MSPTQIPKQSEKAIRWAVKNFPDQPSSVPAYVVAMLSDILGLPIEQVEPNSKFTEDLKADDLEPVEIVLAIEQELGVFISDDDAKGLRTVAELVEYLRIKLSDIEQ